MPWEICKQLYNKNYIWQFLRAWVCEVSAYPIRLVRLMSSPRLRPISLRLLVHDWGSIGEKPVRSITEILFDIIEAMAAILDYPSERTTLLHINATLNFFGICHMLFEASLFVLCFQRIEIILTWQAFFRKRTKLHSFKRQCALKKEVCDFIFFICAYKHMFCLKN